MSARRGKILVIRGGAIGDFILTLPVLAALRAAFPQSELSVLGYPHIAGLASAAGLADEVRNIEGRALASFFAANGALNGELAAFFGGCDLIISFLYDPDRIFEDNVARCGAGQFIAGPHRPNEGEPAHAAQVFLKPLERLAIFDADPAPRISLARDCSLNPPGQWLAAHPGSGSESKNWPLFKWEELLRRFQEDSSIYLLLVGGDAERDRVERLKNSWPSSRLQTAFHLPLVELAKKLNGCRLFLGHDSGITHLAAALGLPGLILWGPSNERIWRPQNARMRVHRSARGLPGIEIDAVEKVARDLWASNKD